MASKHLRVVASLFVAVAAGGCTQNPFRATPAMMPVSFAPQAPSVPLSPSPLPSYANADPKLLETQLARSRQETHMVQEELSALREQLASTSSQLGQARAAAERCICAGVQVIIRRPWIIT